VGTEYTEILASRAASHKPPSHELVPKSWANDFTPKHKSLSHDFLASRDLGLE
jgi:hypothetical protein